MSVRYTKIRKNTKTFQRLFGMSVAQVDIILQKVAPKWHSTVISSYKRPGRDDKLDLSDMILMLLLYYRSYITQIFVGYMFRVDDSRVCRIVHVSKSHPGSVHDFRVFKGEKRPVRGS